MPTMAPGTEVSLRPEALHQLTFPPPDDSVLLVGVHAAALKAPESPHTQLLAFQYGELVWAGALSETLLLVESEAGGDPRALLGETMGFGPRMWDVIWPGELTSGGGFGGAATSYKGERPWVVIGGTVAGDLLAAPLNEAGNPRWYTPEIARDELLMHGSSKDAQLELAHLWSFPGSLPAVGSVSSTARPHVLEAVKKYF